MDSSYSSCLPAAGTLSSHLMFENDYNCRCLCRPFPVIDFDSYEMVLSYNRTILLFDGGVPDSMGVLVMAISSMQSEPFMKSLSFSNGLLVRFILYELIFWPIVGYYVFSDSKKRNMSKPQLRGFILGFLGVIGVFIHFYYQAENKDDQVEDS